MHIRRLSVLLVACLLLLVAAIYFLATLLHLSGQQPPWDFAINWTAAQGMRQGISLYSQPDLSRLGQDLIGPYMAPMFHGTFTSYVGPPSTSLLMLPFTLLEYPTAVIVYRLASILAFAIAILLTGLALPHSARPIAWVAGGCFLLLSYPVVLSIQLGQVDAWVVLAMAVGIWASAKDRWRLAGVAIGLAALLKMSPILLLLYFVVRGKRLTVPSAVFSIAVVLGTSVMLAQPGDLWIFIRDVMPTLSAGSLHIQNQSLAAWIARMILPNRNLLDYAQGTGLFNLLGLPLAACGTILFARRNRTLSYAPEEIGPIILLALLAGPITWDHYASWAILPVMLMSGRLSVALVRSQHRILYQGFIAVAGLLLMMPTVYFDEALIASNWALRIATGTKTMALLILLVLSSLLLARIKVRTASEKRWMPQIAVAPASAS